MDYITARAVLEAKKNPDALDSSDIARLTMSQEDWRELFALALRLWEEDCDRLEALEENE